MRSKADKMSMDAAKKIVGVAKPDAAPANPNATPITEVHSQVGVTPRSATEVKAQREAETAKPPPVEPPKAPAVKPPAPPPAKKPTKTPPPAKA